MMGLLATVSAALWLLLLSGVNLAGRAGGKKDTRARKRVWVGTWNSRRAHGDIAAFLRRVKRGGIGNIQELSEAFGVNGDKKLADACRTLGLRFHIGERTAGELAIVWDPAIVKAYRFEQTFTMHGIAHVSPDRWLLEGFFEVVGLRNTRLCDICTHTIAFTWSRPWAYHLRPRWWGHYRRMVQRVRYLRHNRGLAVFGSGDFNRKGAWVIAGMKKAFNHWYDYIFFARHPQVTFLRAVEGPTYGSDHHSGFAQFEFVEPWPRNRH